MCSCGGGLAGLAAHAQPRQCGANTPGRAQKSCFFCWWAFGCGLKTRQQTDICAIARKLTFFHRFFMATGCEDHGPSVFYAFSPVGNSPKLYNFPRCIGCGSKSSAATWRCAGVQRSDCDTKVFWPVPFANLSNNAIGLHSRKKVDRLFKQPYGNRNYQARARGARSVPYHKDVDDGL